MERPEISFHWRWANWTVGFQWDGLDAEQWGEHGVLIVSLLCFGILIRFPSKDATGWENVK